MATRYVVYIDDNFHPMDESERYKLGEFDDCDSAIAACKKIVDEFLAACDAQLTPAEMLAQYTGYGEDPWIASDDAGCRFSAWQYAEERCKELARTP